MRLIEESDLEMTRRWRNRDDTRVWFHYSEKLTSEGHREWFRNYVEKDDDFLFIIERLSDGKPIGQVSIYNVDISFGKAEFGRIIIGEVSERGKGFSDEATRLATEWAFDRFGLNEIYLYVMKNNAVAIELYERCGFTKRGECEKGVLMSLYKPSLEIDE